MLIAWLVAPTVRLTPLQSFNPTGHLLQKNSINNGEISSRVVYLKENVHHQPTTVGTQIHLHHSGHQPTTVGMQIPLRHLGHHNNNDHHAIHLNNELNETNPVQT
jgi:hypothetical protein